MIIISKLNYILKCMKHGFPHQPSSLAYDSKLKLMAIGNKSGEIKMWANYLQKNVYF